MRKVQHHTLPRNQMALQFSHAGRTRTTRITPSFSLHFFFFFLVWVFHTTAPSSLWHEIPLCFPHCLFKATLKQMKAPAVRTLCRAVSPSSCRRAERVAARPAAPGNFPRTQGKPAWRHHCAAGFSFSSMLPWGKPRCC